MRGLADEEFLNHILTTNIIRHSTLQILSTIMETMKKHRTITANA